MKKCIKFIFGNIFKLIGYIFKGVIFIIILLFLLMFSIGEIVGIIIIAPFESIICFYNWCNDDYWEFSFIKSIFNDIMCDYCYIKCYWKNENT